MSGVVKMDQIILSRGVHQMVMNYIKKDKMLTSYNKQKLVLEMKSAKILPIKHIPKSVVFINRSVRIKDIETDQEFFIELVRPEKAKNKNMKRSILSPIGLALLGYDVGAEVHWEMPDGLKKFLIEEVSDVG